MMIKELFHNEAACKKCATRKVRRQDAKDDVTKVQRCRCGASRYYCWVVDSVMEKGDG